MNIILAGLNIDQEIIKEWRTLLERITYRMDPEPQKPKNQIEKYQILQQCREFLMANNLTPETISAAYARISRDPRPVNLLRAEARDWVSKSRRSNRSIVFGMGHASVAEHAVFNLDVIGISRYALEFIQKHRLCSFTEKSQRYIHLGEDYIIPPEIAGSDLEIPFTAFVKKQFHLYEEIRDILAGATGKDPGETGEDARYALPLCVTSQMGMTANARNVEYLLQHAASSELLEFRQFGEKLFETIDGVAPSVVKYTSGSAAFRYSPNRLTFDPSPEHHVVDTSQNQQEVTLLHTTPNSDDTILNALLMEISGMSSHDAMQLLNTKSATEKRHIFLDVFESLEPWDPVPRAFEYADATFEILISAAAFGQLKRHRMATMTSAPYDPELGITIPPDAANNQAFDLLSKAAEESGALHQQIRQIAPIAAPYVLLGAHRRRVRIKMNARELIHMSRLREDEHAQWDIRFIVQEMVRQARDHMPLALIPAVGKHLFHEYRTRLMTESEV